MLLRDHIASDSPQLPCVVASTCVGNNGAWRDEKRSLMNESLFNMAIINTSGMKITHLVLFLTSLNMKDWQRFPTDVTCGLSGLNRTSVTAMSEVSCNEVGLLPCSL